MTDYISREAAILALLGKGQSSRRYKLGQIWELDFSEIREAIATIPAADVRPVVRGKWEDRCTAGIEETVCSECLHGGFLHFNFCPNCGADMREVEK